MPLTEGQRNAMQGGPDRNKERAQEIKDRRKQRFESKTAPMIGPRGKLNSGSIEAPTQRAE
jgi:hypothetical protein